MDHKKVLILGLEHFPLGDAGARRVSGIVDMLTEIGASVDVVLYPSFGGSDYEITWEADKVRCFGVKSLIQSRQQPKASRVLARLWSVFYSSGRKEVSFAKSLGEKYDLVIVYGGSLPLNIRALWGFRRAVRLYDIVEWDEASNFPYFLINPLFYIKKISLRVFPRYFDGLIVISKFCQDYFKSRGHMTFLLPPVMRGECVLGAVSGVAEHEVTGYDMLDRGMLNIGYVGSPGRKEKLVEFLAAFSRYIHAKPDSIIRVVIVGLDASALVKEFSELIDNDYLIVVGRVPHDCAIRVVGSLDYSLVLRGNSLTNRAGFPSKVVESLSLGTPLIYSDFGDLRDYLTHLQSGLLTPLDDASLDCLFDDIENKGKQFSLMLRRSALETYNKNFMPESYSDKFSGFYREVLSAKI